MVHIVISVRSVSWDTIRSNSFFQILNPAGFFSQFALILLLASNVLEMHNHAPATFCCPIARHWNCKIIEYFKPFSKSNYRMHICLTSVLSWRWTTWSSTTCKHRHKEDMHIAHARPLAIISDIWIEWPIMPIDITSN